MIYISNTRLRAHELRKKYVNPQAWKYVSNSYAIKCYGKLDGYSKTK